MTDGAALPLVLSDLAHDLRRTGILDATITAGHAFGGDLEAVAVPSALALAAHVVGADLAVVGMGPGVVGTASALGTTAVEVAGVIDAAARMGARVALCCRASGADPRERHRGVSHHVRTILDLAATRPELPLPDGAGRRGGGGGDRRRSARRGRGPRRRRGAGHDDGSRARRGSDVLRRRGRRRPVGRRRDRLVLPLWCEAPLGGRRPRSSLRPDVRGEAGTPAQPDRAPPRDAAAAVGGRDPCPPRRLPRRDRRVPPGVRARQGRPSRHGRAARGRDRSRGRARRRGLPHPEGPLLPARPRADPRRARRPAPRRLARAARRPVRPRGAPQAGRARGRYRRRRRRRGRPRGGQPARGQGGAAVRGDRGPGGGAVHVQAARCAPSTRTASTSPGGAGT